MIVKVVSLQFAADSAEAGTRLLLDSLEDTRNFPGCAGVEVLETVGDPTTLHLVERWSTADDSRAYSEWRAGDGAMPELGPMLAGAPSAFEGTVKQ
jgi:quinol monooxygenase YgiN